jgi:hypothetical protein
MSSSTSRINQCKQTFCVNNVREQFDEAQRFIQEINKLSRKSIAVKLQNKELTKDEKKELQKKDKRLMENIKKSKTLTWKDSTMMDICMADHCNPKCLGTILERGKEYPKSLKKKHKYNKIRINEDNTRRKKIFGSKSNVLREDDFYEKIKEKIIRANKKKGAISGCSIIDSFK